MTILTLVAIGAAMLVALFVFLGLGYYVALDAIRRSGYVVERVLGDGPTRYRIGVRVEAPPVVRAVEWIAPRPSAPPLPYAPATNADLARYGHKPRGGGRP